MPEILDSYFTDEDPGPSIGDYDIYFNIEDFRKHLQKNTKTPITSQFQPPPNADLQDRYYTGKLEQYPCNRTSTHVGNAIPPQLPGTTTKHNPGIPAYVVVACMMECGMVDTSVPPPPLFSGDRSGAATDVCEPVYETPVVRKK